MMGVIRIVPTINIDLGGDSGGFIYNMAKFINKANREDVNIRNSKKSDRIIYERRVEELSSPYNLEQIGHSFIQGSFSKRIGRLHKHNFICSSFFLLISTAYLDRDLSPIKILEEEWIAWIPKEEIDKINTLKRQENIGDNEYIKWAARTINRWKPLYFQSKEIPITIADIDSEYWCFGNNILILIDNNDNNEPIISKFWKRGK